MQGEKLILKAKKSIRNWLTNQETKSLVYGSAIIGIEEFLLCKYTHLAVLSTSTSFYGQWIFSEGLISNDNDWDGETKLRQGFAAFYLTFLARCMAHDTNPKRVKHVSCSLHDASLWMAIGLALGHIAEVDVMGRRIVNGLPKKMFFATRTALSPFIPGLWLDSKNEILPDPTRGARQPEEYSEWNWRPVYRELLSNWKSESVQEVLPFLMAACEFHLMESKYGGDSRDYEFSSDCYQIFPQEILAVLRVRQMWGLENPDLDHPLMKSPFAKLFASAPLQLDELLTAIFKKIKIDYPNIEGPWL